MEKSLIIQLLEKVELLENFSLSDDGELLFKGKRILTEDDIPETAPVFNEGTAISVQYGGNDTYGYSMDIFLENAGRLFKNNGSEISLLVYVNDLLINQIYGDNLSGSSIYQNAVKGQTYDIKIVAINDIGSAELTRTFTYPTN